MPNRACVLLACSFLLSTFSLAADAPARTCASLKQLTLPNVTITVAEPVAAGTFVPPNLKPDQKVPPLFKAAPAFCRVAATLAPSSDSDIKVEIWMPAAGWNGKFHGVGNGGFAGSINYSGLAGAVTQGYAVASTDTGHSTEGAEWALGHPEKVTDYGFRAVHEMTVDAKTVVKSFYGDAAKKSYFSSCSNGGRQALMEAQRFPDDYDGILAGAPANSWVPLLTGGLKIAQTLDGPGYIPGSKVPAVARAVLAACDEIDGVKDGVLNDPRQCHFDPSVLLCKEKDSDECLTAPQVASLKQIYAGTRDSAGKLVLPGMLPGSEDGNGGWKDWITGPEEGKSIGMGFVQGNFADFVYGQKDWDIHHASIDASLKLAYEKTGDALDSMNPDLKPFFAHGGKLILYHGWNDPAIPALSTVNYYDSVISTVGKESAEKSVRLYMVPGMQHCVGGPGATWFGQFEAGPRGDAEHDASVALVEWVEGGKAPGTIIAAKHGEDWKVEMTRPLCPYPQVVKYKSGDPNIAASFECKAESK
jgi:Tannase and feruloyl esterase